MWNKNERKGNIDQAKGTVKPAVGDLKGNQKVKAAGTIGATAGKAHGDPDEDAFEDQPYGSALGIIDSDPQAALPWAPKDHSGNPKGIDVRTPATGFGDLHRSLSTTDMGGAGDANEVVSTNTSTDRKSDD